MHWYEVFFEDLLHMFIPSLFSLDINECTQNLDICGLGTCSNNGDGMFYECTCQDGTMATGINSAGNLTCVGKYHVHV